MSKKIKFTTIEQIREYASQRAGDDDKPYSKKKVSEKAWSNVLNMLETEKAWKTLGDQYILKHVKQQLENCICVSFATKEKIYRFVAERIEMQEK